MIATEIGSSIEGMRLDFVTRKFIPAFPRKDEVIDQIVYHFRLSILAKGEIGEEHVPKFHVFCNKSMLNKGDEIQGERITGYSIRPIPTPTIKKASAKHKGSHFSAVNQSFAKIEIGVRHLMQKKIKS